MAPTMACAAARVVHAGARLHSRPALLLAYTPAVNGPNWSTGGDAQHFRMMRLARSRHRYLPAWGRASDVEHVVLLSSPDSYEPVGHQRIIGLVHQQIEKASPARASHIPFYTRVGWLPMHYATGVRRSAPAEPYRPPIRTPT